MTAIRRNLEIVCFERRTLLRKPTDREDVLRRTQVKSAKRCIFGPSDPKEDKKMLDEVTQNDRRRCREKYGIDIDALDEEMKENENRGNGDVGTNSNSHLDLNMNRKRRSGDDGVLRRICNKQPRLIDIYQIRKRPQTNRTNKEEE